MYCIHDVVLYGAEGVCRIDGITQRNFAGINQEYYVLHPVDRESSTIYVPTRSDTLKAKMRRILSQDEIMSLIRQMPKEELLAADSEEERKQNYAKALASGDRRDLIRLIKTVYQRGQTQKACGRKMYARDETALHEAEKILYSEFAYVLGMHTDEVLTFITGELEAQQA
ncbi:MAG: CarD family transcriptional regulator [Eubacteriales bacterium]|nr:CarD family transcriptional regulator [Eubacteriales bacterium]